MRKVVSLIGVPDDNKGIVVYNKGDPAKIKISFDGTNDLNTILDKSTYEFNQITLGGEGLKIPELAPVDLIINAISDADINKKSLYCAKQIVSQLSSPVINHPEKIITTTRDHIYEQVRNIKGVRAPTTIRTSPDCIDDVIKIVSDYNINLPIIFREAGFHNGRNTLLVSDDGDFTSLERFAFDGRDYYIIQYVDYKSEDGLYRKYRYFVIDGVPYARHLIISSSWNIHAGSRNELMSFDQYQSEEKSFLDTSNPIINEIIHEIYNIINLDYFGIDCSIINNNELLIFEINAAMKPFASKLIPYHQAAISQIKNSINFMISSRL